MATTAETCDRHPSAAAAFFARRGELVLTLCGHCVRENIPALAADGWWPTLIHPVADATGEPNQTSS